MGYDRANTGWLARCRYGLSVHWTAQTLPRRGEPVRFQEAVERFDLERFAVGVAEAGADYVIFTVTHALQMLPMPHPASASADRLAIKRRTGRERRLLQVETINVGLRGRFCR